ncbi:MAG: hypothetical protein NW223_14915 [Hyphomicrobiaceae bacterium]|nr:hypothetical protein [Hyphomicrobiaceae bacterium]
MRVSQFLTSIISVIALAISAYTLYESSLRAPQIATFVAPRIDYVDPDRPEAVREVFILPMTIANDGARQATVMAVTLEVTNPRTKQSKTFYAARIGAWGDPSPKPFAPVPLAGKATFSQALQFEPHVGEEVARVLDSEPGSYRLKLTLATAQAASLLADGVAPLEFEMQAGQMDYRMFQGAGTLMMWAPGYQPASSARR